MRRTRGTGARFNDAAVFQPVDSDLTAIAALTSTTAGRNLLTLVTAAAYTQTYTTAARTVPDATVAAVVTTGAGLASYGFTQAQADAIPVAINALAADVLALKKVLTALIDDLQALNVVG